MAKEGLTEEEAFERLRQASQVSGRPMKVIADAVIAYARSVMIIMHVPRLRGSAPGAAPARAPAMRGA